MIAKDRILEAATELFYKRGVNATGIDLIISEAGIAKATLYNNFESKEVLVAKYLERLRLKFEENLQQAVSKQGRSLTIPFDLLETTVVQGEFSGVRLPTP
jgi:AcrR family transcriptional regulator